MKKAYVFISCDLEKEEVILDRLRKIKSVKEAHATLGSYEVIAEILAMDYDELQNQLTLEIPKAVPSKSTLTLTVVEGKSR